MGIWVVLEVCRKTFKPLKHFDIRYSIFDIRYLKVKPSFMKPLFLFLFFSAALTAQTRYYVNPAAFGQNNGLTWYDAFTDLHSAFALAQAGDEIWVAEGVYLPSQTGDRSAHFDMLAGVKVYGGFVGTEMDLSQRDWEAHPTVLDGDIGVPGDSTDNTYNLLFLKNPTAGTRIDGLFFRHALANKVNSFYPELGGSGAGLFVLAESGQAYLDVQYCVFGNNTSLGDGGAVYIQGAQASFAPQFMDCRFLSNRSVNFGGGGVAKSGSSVIEMPRDFYRCTFINNFALSRGSAIHLLPGNIKDTISILECTFEKNQSNESSDIGAGGVINIGLSGFSEPAVVELSKNSFSDSQLNYPGSVLGSINTSFESGDIHWYIDSSNFENNRGIILSYEVGSNSKLRCTDINLRNQKFGFGGISTLTTPYLNPEFESVNLINSNFYVSWFSSFDRLTINQLSSFSDKEDRGNLFIGARKNVLLNNIKGNYLGQIG
jgi:hypothetical protein